MRHEIEAIEKQSASVKLCYGTRPAGEESRNRLLVKQIRPSGAALFRIAETALLSEFRREPPVNPVMNCRQPVD